VCVDLFPAWSRKEYASIPLAGMGGSAAAPTKLLDMDKEHKHAVIAEVGGPLGLELCVCVLLLVKLMISSKVDVGLCGQHPAYRPMGRLMLNACPSVPPCSTFI
jgi:hypothetical protein